jgi:hypothetical protein
LVEPRGCGILPCPRKERLLGKQGVSLLLLLLLLLLVVLLLVLLSVFGSTRPLRRPVRLGGWALPPKQSVDLYLSPAIQGAMRLSIIVLWRPMGLR